MSVLIEVTLDFSRDAVDFPDAGAPSLSGGRYLVPKRRRAAALMTPPSLSRFLSIQR
jgi:hypothetical protein